MDTATRRGPGRPATERGARKRWVKTRAHDDEADKIWALIELHGYPATEGGLRDYLLADAERVLGQSAA
ncbi:hypothetical protein Acsp01_87000 [Actinoplanes sp. NBRC 101535]|nr:hypothetical protein Acsp01_87000 [Actinoplanes sp. NBRC 101535]